MSKINTFLHTIRKAFPRRLQLSAAVSILHRKSGSSNDQRKSTTGSHDPTLLSEPIVESEEPPPKPVTSTSTSQAFEDAPVEYHVNVTYLPVETKLTFL